MDAKRMRAIGKRLREKREQAGYTREQFAELCDISSRFVANIESGTSSLSLDTLLSFCLILSCSSDSLLFGETVDPTVWGDTVGKIEHLDIKYKKSFDHLLNGVLETIVAANKETDPPINSPEET